DRRPVDVEHARDRRCRPHHVRVRLSARRRNVARHASRVHRSLRWFDRRRDRQDQSRERGRIVPSPVAAGRKSARDRSSFMTEYQDLLWAAYEGELFGEAFFETMAAAETDPDRKAKLLVLQEIEGRTARTLEPLARESGVPVGDGGESRRTGNELGSGAAAA